MSICEKNETSNLIMQSISPARIRGLFLFGLIAVFAQGLGVSILSAEPAKEPAEENGKIKYLRTIDFNSRRKYFQVLNLTVLEKEKKMFVVNPAGVGFRWGVAVYDSYLREIVRFGKVKVKRPVDLATDGEKIYIVDAGDKNIKVCDSRGKYLYRFSGFKQPQSIAVNPRRKWVYVSDVGSSRVKVFDYDGNFILDFGNLNRPQSITVDKDGKVYVVEPLTCQVKIFDALGTKLIKKFGDELLFARPSGIAVDSKMNIYVLDTALNTLQVFDSRGVPLYVYGKKGKANDEFSSPNGIYIDENDVIYIADTNNQRVQIFEIVK